MTDTQLLTLAIAVIVPLSLLIFSNSRVSDVGKRIDDAKETLRAEIGRGNAELRGEIRVALLGIDNKLDHIIETQADHSTRLATLESGHK